MKLWCKVCDQDHNGGMRKFCDRSLNELKIDRLEDENAKLREALEVVAKITEVTPLLTDGAIVRVRQVLKGRE